MSQAVFKTEEDALYPVHIVGAGSLGPEGKGGVPIEKAALGMTELQEKDEEGRVVLDDEGQPKPLSGNKLREAARELAEARGWRIVNMAEEKVAELPHEWGVPADRPPAAEVAAEAYERIYGEEYVTPVEVFPVTPPTPEEGGES
jgi:hypothetical protein